jgi:branched-chain amino acid transport system substrate-binding protein
MRRLLISMASLLLVLPGACTQRPARVVLGIALSSANHPAVELAAKEINASGGLGGVPLELMGLEWKIGNMFNAEEIVDWANRFADTDDLLAVIGHSDSSSTLSAAALYNKKGVPQIVTIATNPAITNIGDWTYRLCISDAAQGPALAEYAVRDWGKRRIAILYVNDAYGRGLAELFETRVPQIGGEIVASMMHRNVLQVDDQEMIQSWLRTINEGPRPDLFVLFQRVDAALWTIGEIRKLGIKVDILGGDSLSPLNFLQRDPVLLEGLRVSQFFIPNQDDPRAAKFVRDFREGVGSDPDYGNAFAYDAVYLVREAIMQGGYSRDGVKSYLDRVVRERSDLPGVAGVYTMGLDHDARRALHIVEARGGSHHLLKTLPLP